MATLRTIARFLFILPLIIAPWLIGSAEPHWHPLIVWPLLASFVVWLLAWLVTRRSPGQSPRPISWPKFLFPMLLAVAWGGFLLLPIWQAEGNTSSIASVALQKQFAEGLPELPENWAISVHSTSTLRQMAWLTLAATVVFLAANLFRHRQTIMPLLIALAVNGVALTLFAIIQRATYNGRLYWIGPRVSSEHPFFGPFVYHNQGANLLAISIAALIGWFLLSRSQRRDEGHRHEKRHHRSHFYHAASPLHNFLIFVIAVGLAAGLLVTLSRGMWLSVVVGGIVAAIVVLRTTGRSIPWRWLLPIIVGAVALVGWVGMNELTTARLASVLDEDTFTEEGRLDHWREGIAAAADHWAVGVGYGAYRYVIPQYHLDRNKRGARHAHNQYIETLVEGGTPALLLLLVAIGLLGYGCWSLLGRSDSLSQALGAVGFFALISQGLHAVGDFCLVMPANLIAFSALVGVVLGHASRQHDGDSQVSDPQVTDVPLRQQKTGWLLLPATLGLLLLCCGACWVIQLQANVYSILVSVPWNVPTEKFSPAMVNRQIVGLEQQLAAVPGDAEGFEALGELYVARYRLQARKSLSEQTGVLEQDANLWQWTDPSLLYQKSHQFRAQSDGAMLQGLLRNPTVASNLLPAKKALQQSLVGCPLLPQPHLRWAELSFLENDENPSVDTTTDIQQLTQAGQLDPSNYDRLFKIGQLHFYAGRFDRAWKAWRQSLQLTPKHLNSVLNLAGAVLDGDQIVEQVLPADPMLVLRTARRVPISARGEIERQKILAHAERLARQMPVDDDTAGRTRSVRPTREALLGSILALQGHPDEAIPFLRSAVRKQATDLELRFELAQRLAQVGKLEEARREATYCLRMRPKDRRYKLFHRQLTEAQLSR